MVEFALCASAAQLIRTTPPELVGRAFSSKITLVPEGTGCELDEPADVLGSECDAIGNELDVRDNGFDGFLASLAVDCRCSSSTLRVVIVIVLPFDNFDFGEPPFRFALLLDAKLLLLLLLVGLITISGCSSSSSSSSW